VAGAGVSGSYDCQQKNTELIIIFAKHAGSANNDKPNLAVCKVVPKQPRALHCVLALFGALICRTSLAVRACFCLSWLRCAPPCHQSNVGQLSLFDGL
jgi:hypothetical protein